MLIVTPLPGFLQQAAIHKQPAEGELGRKRHDMPYTIYSHWFLMHRLLTGAGVEQVQLNSDIDSMTRAAFLTAYADEVNRGDAHAFFVKYTKWETIDERRRTL